MPSIAILKEGKEKKIKNFYPWIFRDEIQKLEVKEENGIVKVFSKDKEFLGIGLLNIESNISIRMISREDISVLDTQFFSKKIQKALERRKNLDRDFFRVVFAESDEFPGIIIDKYQDLVVFQFRSFPLQKYYRNHIINAIIDTLNPKTLIERTDVNTDKVKKNIEVLKGENYDTYSVLYKNTKIFFSPIKGQKTGLFLDQIDNWWKISQLVKPGYKVLDVFSYVGGFTLMCLKKGATVTSIDKDPNAIEMLNRSLRENNLEGKVRIFTGDAFQILQELSVKEQNTYDLVILDPPALVKTKQDIKKRLQLFIELVKYSIRLVKDGGLVVYFSCAYNIDKEILSTTARIAGYEESVRLVVIDELIQSLDHPWILQIPESLYLKGLIIKVEKS